MAMIKVGPALRRQWQQILQEDNWRDYISAQLWADIDRWEGEGGRCV